MGLALKAELETERKLRRQQQNTAVQKLLMATEANVQQQIVKAQQQQQIKVDHEKVSFYLCNICVESSTASLSTYCIIFMVRQCHGFM